jgi:phosphate:Na+ symporter
MAQEIITAVLTLIAGVGAFLLAMELLSTNLEMMSGNSMKKLFAKTSKSQLLGVGIGTAATVLVQSSGAVSVMVIGFVNAGLMSLKQAATIIYGANVGTTLTAQVAALGLLGDGIGVSMSVIFGSITGIGAIIMLVSKKPKVKNIGGFLTGFGLMFIGMDMMSGAMEGLAMYPQFTSFIAFVTDPILLVLIGTALTAVMQSSSVFTVIILTMIANGLISLDQGIYLTLGSNIGSCVVAVIACVGSITNSKRTALIHLLFNVFGVVIYLIIDAIMIKTTPHTFSWMLEQGFPGAPATQLAMLHTIFNIASVIVILPFTNMLVKLVVKMIPDKKPKPNPNDPRLSYIDEHLLKTPPIAVQQTKNEIIRMAEIAMRNFNLSLDTICTMNLSKKEQFKKDENLLNFMNREIVRFVVELSKTESLTDDDRNYLATTFRTVTDIERIGDYAENIMEYADKLNAVSTGFSEDAVLEIRKLQALIANLYQKVMKTYVNVDTDMLKEAYELEDKVDDLTALMSDSHIKRLDDGLCSPDVGAQYLSLASNAERVADHFINVAKSIRGFSKRAKEKEKIAEAV